MSARCEDDLCDDEFFSNMETLEASIVQYVRKIGGQLHLSNITQNACMKRALLTALLDMVEHEPCDLARGEVIMELAEEWDRRVRAMKMRPATPTAH